MQKQRAARLVSIVLAALAALLAAPRVIAQETDQIQVRLRSAAAVRAERILLADVADLQSQSADAEQIGAVAIRTSVSPGDQIRITHADLSAALEKAAVNAARLVLAGALACDVQVLAPADEATPPPSPVSASMRRAADDGNTLADAIRRQVRADLGDISGEVEIDFERATHDVLDLASPPYTFVLRSADRERLGLRQFTVTLRRDGRIERTLQIAARVRLIKPVVVAIRPLNVGAYVRYDDIKLDPRVFERIADVGLDAVQAVVGQQVAAFVPAGEMVPPRSLKPVDMVTRSQRVTLTTGGQGRVAISLTGVALDRGIHGDKVRVRLGEGRGDRRIVQGVVTDFGKVAIAGE